MGAPVLFLGYLGWTLPDVGGSVIVPTLIVFAIGAILTIAGSALVRLLDLLRVLAISSLVITVLATIWTFQFSLAMRLQFSNATAQAIAVLNSAEHSSSNLHGTVPVQPCTVHASGSIGPLPAPYRECVTYTTEGHSVRFTRVGSESGGLAYIVDLGRNVDAFPDECVRPLIGHWSMVTVPKSDGSSLCPIGYKDSGGG